MIECNCVTGDYSMLMEVVFHTTSELDQFIGQLQHFGRTKTQIVFSTSVEHRGIPLGDTRIPILEQEEEKVDFLRTFRYTKACYKTGIPLGDGAKNALRETDKGWIIT